MKLVTFGDIHMAAANAASIPGIGAMDLVLLNGDLTNYGGVREAKSVLDDVLRYNLNVLAQFGNLDRPEINDYLESLGMNLHGQARLFEGEVCIVGIGGSNPTPFNTPSEFSESGLLEAGERAFEEAREYVTLGISLYKKTLPVILICHAPPFNTKVDRLRNGRPVGSKAIRSLIEKYRPALVITGHIHEAKGLDHIDGIPIYNPGMFRLGGYVIVEINQSQLSVHLE